jgi:hypothetical protein
LFIAQFNTAARKHTKGVAMIPNVGDVYLDSDGVRWKIQSVSAGVDSLDNRTLIAVGLDEVDGDGWLELRASDPRWLEMRRLIA